MRCLVLSFVSWGQAAFQSGSLPDIKSPEQESFYSLCQGDHLVEATCHQGPFCVLPVQTSQLMVTPGLVKPSMSTKLFNHLHIHAVRYDRQQTADELRRYRGCRSYLPYILSSRVSYSFLSLKNSWLEWSGHRPTDKLSATGTAMLSSMPHHIISSVSHTCLFLQMHAVEDDRRQLADKVSATEAAGYSFMADKLAQLEAQLAAKDAQLQTERARAAR